MKPSTELFKLIKSLSKSEKRFFKLSSTLQSGDKNYLKIFDFIEAQNSYDEEHLKSEFAGETFVKHLPSEKNHLYKLILKSLRAYYSEQSVSSLLKQEIKNVEILYNKALYKECEKFVSRAKRLASEHEKFYYLYELLSWEKKLLEEAYEEGEFGRDLDELIREEEEVIAKLRNLAEYQVIYSKINLIFRSGGFTRTDAERLIVDDIANHHLIKAKNTALSIRASSICYYIKGICAATNRNFQDSFVFFNKTREILDKHPDIKADSGQRYVMTLGHLLRCYIDGGDYRKAEELIGDIRSLDGLRGFDSMDIKVRIFTRTSNLELMLLHTMGEFDRAIELVQKIEEDENVFSGKITKEQEVLLVYNKAYSYFGCGMYRKALSYINKVLNDNEQNLRQDIYSFSRLFNLVLHLELENYDFLEYSIKSTNRYFSKQGRNFEVENSFISHLRKLSRGGNSDERMTILKRLKSELDVILTNENERVVLEYFNIVAWVNSKVNKISFSEAVRWCRVKE
jgi:tetratricopeptide (TPR) repeat protein